MDWYFNDKPLGSPPDGCIGFVYCIHNKLDGRAYIGKKNFFFSKTKQVKGKKKRIKMESDWKDYWSSSPELKADVQRLGSENFSREILHLCKTRGELNYLEAHEQFARHVLFSEKYYNSYIMCRINRSHVANLQQVIVKKM